MIKPLFLIIFLCFSLSVFGQNAKKLDSLVSVLDRQKEDTNKLNTLIDIQDLFADNQSNKKFEYLEKAENLVKKLKIPAKEREVDMLLGTYYSLTSNYEKSLEYHLKSAKIAEQLNQSTAMIRAYLGVGQAFMHVNNQSNKAKTYLDKAEMTVHSKEDSSVLSYIIEQKAYIAFYQKNYEEALKSHFRALPIAKKYNSKRKVGNIFDEIGLTYNKQKKTVLALQYLDSALVIYQKMPKFPFLEMSFVNSDIGSTYSEAGKYKLAHEAFNKSLDFAKQANHPETIMENYGYLAELYGREKNYQQKSVFLEKYYSLKDSLFNSDSKAKLTELESDYQIEKKNATLAKEEAENVKSKNQRNFFLAIALAALFLVAGLGIFNRRIQLKNTQINIQKDELQQLNHVKDRLFAILSHDLRNPLVTLKTYLSLSSNPNLSSEKKEKYKEQTQQAVSQTSNLLDNLLVWANLQLKNSKPSISQIDLKDCIDDAVGAVAAQAQQKQIEIIKKVEVFTANSNQGILEVALRNILTNAIKFSNEGSLITIFAKNEGNQAIIGILDNGIGMSRSKMDEILNAKVQHSAGTLGEKGNGLGLFLVIELLQKINAALLIESQEGQGSKFMIKL